MVRILLAFFLLSSFAWSPAFQVEEQVFEAENIEELELILEGKIIVLQGGDAIRVKTSVNNVEGFSFKHLEESGQFRLFSYYHEGKLRLKSKRCNTRLFQSGKMQNPDLTHTVYIPKNIKWRTP